MQELNFENFGKAFEGGICLFMCIISKPKSQRHNPKSQNLGVIIWPTQTMHCHCQGQIPQNYHRFAACLVPPRWVSFNDPQNFLGKIPQPPGRDEGTWENCHGRLEERIARRAIRRIWMSDVASCTVQYKRKHSWLLLCFCMLLKNISGFFPD